MGTSKLIFKIGPDGGTTVEGSDFKDGKCLKEAERFLMALGTVESQHLKPEAYNGGEATITINN